MQTSENGRKLIESFEGLRLTSYQDQGGVWTIGYGHTGPDVFGNITITQAEADDFLGVDLHHAETAVCDAVKVDLNQNQFDALVSLAYNIGGRAFTNSTIVRILNTGDYLHAADKILDWNRVAGQINRGLVKRRAAERVLFLTPVVSQ